jgi:hypothetical protein
MSAARFLARRALIVGLMAAPLALAHTLGSSELRIESDSGTPQATVRWDIAIMDLYSAIDLDANGDGSVTAGELQAAQPLIESQVLPQLRLARGGEPCSLRLSKYGIDQRIDGWHASLDVAATCAEPGPIAVDYRFLFDIDASHRAVVLVREDGRDFSVVLTPELRAWQSEHTSAVAAFGSFVREGVHHIWIGYDHIAFLLLLLLPSVLRPAEGGWRAASDSREVTWRIVRIVTAFTIAHSITLTLATLGIVVLPARPVEIAIAASVLLAGLMNLVPTLAERAALIAFAFGLVHGFGFANVLAELGLREGALAASLAGFNVGVELGQLAVVLVLLPVIFRARTTEFYRRRFLPAASMGMAMLALGWLLQRSV